MTEPQPESGDEASHAKPTTSVHEREQQVSDGGQDTASHVDDGDEHDDEDEEHSEEDDEEDEEEDEPKLKYARLTHHLGPVYRNGDATSAFLVAGDKMVIGTQCGNIHVIQLPTFQPLLAYHAHDASVTSISISPYPPPSLPSTLKPEAVSRAMADAASIPTTKQSDPKPSPAKQQRTRELPQVPNLPSNNIYIGTSSQDGMVRVQPLIDLKDFQLRNFARPVQAVAMSPDFKNDRTYISGGRAGNLILTVGAPSGRSTSTTTGTATAAASGWLGSIGIGANSGKDTVLHSGEGNINTIKWSLSGRYVVWLNEHGIKIMRSKLHLESADAEDAWKRIGHIDRPQTDEWEEMAGFWPGRVEWIDDEALQDDEAGRADAHTEGTLSPATTKLSQQARRTHKEIERLLVGWGEVIWIIHVHPGSKGFGKHVGEKSIGRAEIVKILRMDCIISGISLYTPNLLLVLAYCKPDEDEDEDPQKPRPGKGHKAQPSTASSGSEPSGGRKRRRNAQRPELRLIDLNSQAEVHTDTLTVRSFEGLSSNDYHLGVLPATKAASVVASRGTLEALAGIGNDMWNAAINPKALFSSGASIRSRDSNDAASSGHRIGSTAGSVRVSSQSFSQPVHPNLVKPGAKIFIHSVYDCILATSRDRGDHLAWLLEHKRYQEAWELLDKHPDIMNTPLERPSELGSSTPDRQSSVTEDFYEESLSGAELRGSASNTLTEKEKRRIGELWVQELVEEGEWNQAAAVIAKVVNTPDRWEKWVYTFAGAKKFDEIANYIPSEPMHPPIPGTIYEIVLGHYIQTDKPRFKELLDHWGSELFNVHEISTALEDQLRYRDVREESVEDGEKGRDWRIVVESLARLYEAEGRYRDALKRYIKLQDADSAMRLIRDNHLAEAVTDDVPSFIALRVPEAQLSRMSVDELEEATSEAITLLVEETHRGLVKPEIVVTQLEQKNLNTYLYFYFQGLWAEYRERPVDETVSLLDSYADLAVHIFAAFKRELLMDFLKVSTSYSFDKAVQECENSNYIPELVYLYSRTGQMKRALYLIIDRLGDVSQAIAFAKEQNDPDLWEDLLNYSMDKPRFIRALLEEVGTSIDPITLIRRIPGGLEIPGLREGLKHIMKEHEIQYSISSGVARVLRSEVAAAQNQLRSGQRKGIKFGVVVQGSNHIDIQIKEVPSIATASTLTPTATLHTNVSEISTAAPVVPPSRGSIRDGHQPEHDHREAQPGHCASCHEPFTEWEMETLVGFACGHVFHITHLLEALGQRVDSGVLSSGEDRSRGGRLVGSKVTRARLLRDRVEGCPKVSKCFGLAPRAHIMKLDAAQIPTGWYLDDCAYIKYRLVTSGFKSDLFWFPTITQAAVLSLNRHTLQHQRRRPAQLPPHARQAQLVKVPFENLTQHYSWHRVVDVKPQHLFRKIVAGADGVGGRGRGGYCMEANSLFHTVLLSLGFAVYVAGAQVYEPSEGIYGFSHCVNIVTIGGVRYIVDVGFGANGPVGPVPLEAGLEHAHVEPARVRLLHEPIPQQTDQGCRVWIYQHCDIRGMNLSPWTSNTSFFTRKVVVVRFTTDQEDDGDSGPGPGSAGTEAVAEGAVDGALILFEDSLKWRRGGETKLEIKFETESMRVDALRRYFGIELDDEDREAIRGTVSEIVGSRKRISG
ncbi:Uu.00g146590.m01.CDS01 [Anthostomella pinea]|uniref:Uu.00g146590.m01.CDS01 n=1 Tax=Anthostomella pinea TaxID=933095 RepID=A0AAI8YLU9_9PEZI|nr:Uu.00g146590.m01.CDS01 [Anthostomella pinea]